MEPTPEGAGTGAGTGERDVEVAELTPTAVRRRPTRVAVASLSAIALLATAVGVLATRPHHDAPPLVLVPGGRSAAPAALPSGELFPSLGPLHYRLAITPPDLGSTAAVARLEAPPVDDARVRSMAEALGMHGTVNRLSSAGSSVGSGGGWQVSDGKARLTLEPTPGGWAVSYTPDAVESVSGGVPGQTGSGGSSGSGVATSGSTTADRPSTVIPPQPVNGSTVPTTPITVVPDTTAPAPANLPAEADAQRIARSLLERMGVTGEWSATVEDTTLGGGVVCAPEPCATPMHVAVISRTVELRPRFDGIAVDGLAWRAEIGDAGRIEGVSGTWAEMRTLGRYPLRSVATVFADLVAGRGTDPYPEPVPLAMREQRPEYPLQSNTNNKIVTVTIDHIALGFAVMPASDHGAQVVDVVPTYLFAGRTTSGENISRRLVAVEATVTTPATVPGTPTSVPKGAGPPLGTPEPQPGPGTGTSGREPAASGGTPTT